MWMQMLSVSDNHIQCSITCDDKVFGASSVFLPLSTAVWGSDNAVWGSEEQKTVCFEQLHFGVCNHGRTWSFQSCVITQVPRVDYSDGDLINDYIMFVRRQLGLADLPLPSSPKIGIISRKNRRRIVNENDLLSLGRNILPTELIEYSGMTFLQQVRSSLSWGHRAFVTRVGI